MLNILQLRQEQIPDLPFTFYRGLVLVSNDAPLVTDHEGRYLMVPTQMYIGGDDNITYLYNAILKMAQMKGFTHLMLIYV